MRYLPTGKWMQKADAYTIQEIGLPSLVLMEQAAVETVAIMEREQIRLEKALVLCGSGNNGGDGFAIARLLREKGYCAETFFAGKKDIMSIECQCQKSIAEKCGVPTVTTITEKEYTVIIDAIFGVGLNRNITGATAQLLMQVNEFHADKVAVDIPSGICAETGNVLGTAFQAELTVTFCCQKIGCILHPGYGFTGRTVIANIGIHTKLFEKEPAVYYTFDKSELPALLPARKPNSHKGTYGRILMITGSEGMAGAAYLSAKAAYTAGAGLIQIYTPKGNRTILQQLLPEAIVSVYDEYEEEKVDSLLSWADVVCIGCGLGQTPLAAQIMERVLQTIKIPCVIDADGLNLLAGQPQLLGPRERPIVLTPHMKEMTGLLGCTVTELQEKRFEMIRSFTAQNGVTCVLKDARTIVAKWDRQIFVNTAGNSGMAKAGSGDVLSGVIAGLMAQGMEAYEAAAVGVYLHACGGDEAKEEKGSYSMLAEDLIKGIGICLKKTEEKQKHETI